MYIENKETKKRNNIWKKNYFNARHKEIWRNKFFVNLVCFLSDKKNRLITGQEISIGTVI